jgi:hypothetical protein
MTSLPDSLGERGMSVLFISPNCALINAALLLPKHNQPQSSDELEVAERRLPPRAGYRRLWKQIRDALLDSETPTDVESAGWVEWGRQQIESDAMVTPLMIITFSCAYVLCLSALHTMSLTIIVLRTPSPCNGTRHSRQV